jgi:hypothetical protein
MHSFAARSLRRSPDNSPCCYHGMSPYHLVGSIVGPAAFVRAGVQHRANEIGGFLMAITGDFWAVGQAIRRSNYH